VTAVDGTGGGLLLFVGHSGGMHGVAAATPWQNFGLSLTRDRRVRLFATTGSGDQLAAVDSTHTLREGAWSHVAVCMSSASNDVGIAVNGEAAQLPFPLRWSHGAEVCCHVADGSRTVVRNPV
jgi:hypothetical protein